MNQQKHPRVTEITFSKYNREVYLGHLQFSNNDYYALTQKVAVKHKFLDKKKRNFYILLFRILQPYLSKRFIAQLQAVLPLAAYMILFQVFLLRQNIENGLAIGLGLSAVIIGLMCFMEGLRIGLMPFGEIIGETLPNKARLGVVLLVIFVLGIGVTFAEPAIGALRTAGALVGVEQSPYLYLLLNQWSLPLVLVVGAGVGFAAMLGGLRFLYGWSLKPLIYIAIVPVLVLTVIASSNEHLRQVIGLAWDCGAVTTGPVTVPLVLALGIGIASAASSDHKQSGSLSGFGIVTMASLFPILGVLSLSFYALTQLSPEEIIAMSAQAQSVSETAAKTVWFKQTPFLEIIGGLRAIIPLVLFLLFVQFVLLRSRVQDPVAISFGIFLTVLGMIIFNIGLSYGLVELGQQAGSMVPAAFRQISAVDSSPLYGWGGGLVLAIAFAWFLGFGATMAEPALNALGLTVEKLTQGVFKRANLLYAVSFGVACGIAVGVAKIIFSIPIVWLLLPSYAVALLLTLISQESYVNVAWDSAGVTTGPVTVPLVLALGLGLGNAVGALEGFAILAMASVGPIISVMLTGLWLRVQAKLNERRTDTLSNETVSSAPDPVMQDIIK